MQMVKIITNHMKRVEVQPPECGLGNKKRRFFLLFQLHLLINGSNLFAHGMNNISNKNSMPQFTNYKCTHVRCNNEIVVSQCVDDDLLKKRENRNIKMKKQKTGP